LIDALTFGSIFYGIHKRISIFWKMIPALILIFILKMNIFADWYLISHSLPWLPFLAMMIVICLGGGMLFVPWWRQQKSYFET